MQLVRPARWFATGALVLWSAGAHAVVTYSIGTGTRSITMTVGSNDTTVNTVTFDVLNANIAPSPAPVQGVPGNGAPATSPSGGVTVTLQTNRRGNAPDVVKLLVDSSAGMACQSGVCTSSPLTIPFTTVSWTSYEAGGGAFSAGIASGSFNGSASQLLFSGQIPTRSKNSMLVSNVLVFSYNNATLYPSGSYRGRVTYTVTVP